MKAAKWISPLLLLLSGCMFSETSYPYDPGERVVVESHTDATPMTTRQWLANATPQLNHFLQDEHQPLTLVTGTMIDATGQPVDVATHFDIEPDRMESIFHNYYGLVHSAQATMPHGPPHEAPPWEGFEDVWVPIADDLYLAGRLGWARDESGEPINAPCIVILPGIRGNNNILRVRDLAAALHGEGFHVLTLELRGTGMTDQRFPQYDYTWGVYETDDLLAVADWLQAHEQVSRTGLVGYSWGGNHAIMAAWADGRTDDSGIPENLRHIVAPPAPDRHRYEAGVIALSPVVRNEDLIERLAVEREFLINPALTGLQNTFRGRMIEKGYPNPSGSVRELIRRADLGYDEPLDDILEYVRLMDYEGLPAHDRFSAIRVPVLMVQGANDPIGPAQDMADLVATIDNPNVAAIMIGGGGHIGFAPYSSGWYYNLILNFFDPTVGTAASADR